MVKGWWDSYRVEGGPRFCLAKKMKLLKEDLKGWNNDVFGKMDVRVARLLEEIKALDEKEGKEGFRQEEEEVRDDKKGEVGRLMISEEVSWRQKSRVIYIKEGDRNTKFFHKMANAHRHYNHIGRLVDNEEAISREEDIAVAIVEFYDCLYTELRVRRPLLDDLDFKQISEED